MPNWGDYIVNAVGIATLMGILFIVQPSILTGPVDGVFTYANVVQKLMWQPPGDPYGTYYPLEAMGSRLVPLVIPLLPHLWPFLVTSDPVVQVWLVYVTLAVMLAIGLLAYYRAAGTSRAVAIASTWLAASLAMLMSDLARSSWQVIYGQVGLVVALALYLHVGRGGRRHNAIYLTVFCIFVVAYLVADHNVDGYLAGPELGLALIAHLLGTSQVRERWWKLGTLGASAVVVLALGIPQWMSALAMSTSRYVFFNEVIAQPQYAYNAGMIFRSQDAITIVYALAVVGTIGELGAQSRGRRTIAALTAFMCSGQAIAGALWLWTDIQWRAPAPAYYNVMAFPWLALMAIRGLAYTFTWRPDPARSRSTRWLGPIIIVVALGCFVEAKLYSETASWYIIAVSLVTLALGIVCRLARLSGWAAEAIVYLLGVIAVVMHGDALNYQMVIAGSLGRTNGAQQVAAENLPFVPFLRDEVGVTPGSQFRGYADSISPEHFTLLVIDFATLTWHVRGIPTLSQYTTYVTPFYYLFITRLLEEPTDRPNVNHMPITRVDTRLLRMLGLRYLASEAPLNDPDVMPRATEGTRTLYELRDPNLASYSPIHLQRSTDARAILDHLSNPSFDPRAEAIIADDAPDSANLVPASTTTLTFVRGGFRFTALSPGRSLVVLPIQFTRCLEVRVIRGRADGIQALRTNLIETGLLFTGDIDVEGIVHFSGPTQRCPLLDVADADRLGVPGFAERRRMPDYSRPGSRWAIFAPFGLD